ncbi:MAG: porin [Bacteroidales bacterium]|nr:porin [Bacteroidales bacterium]
MKKLFFSALAILVGFVASAQVKEEGAQYNQYGVKVQIEELAAESQDGFLVLRAKQGEYKLWLDCRVQADGAVFFGAPDYADKIGNGVSIRRARFAVKAQLTKNWYGEIDMDMANGVFELKDAIIKFSGIPYTEITVGNFKEFFSIQRNNSSRYLQFMERPMIAQALAPSRAIGGNIKFYKDWAWVSAGGFFQPVDNLETRTFVEDSNKDYGVNPGVSATAKVVFMPGFDKTDYGFHIALAASYRTPKASDENVATKGIPSVRYSTRNSNSINRKKYIDTDEITNVRFDILHTAEFAGYWKGFRWEAAYMGTLNYVVDQKTPSNLFGWYAQGGILLFGGRQRYDCSGAKFTRPERGRKWGDLELCFRYEMLDFNGLQSGPAGAAEAYTAGLNYYINNHAKIMLNYQYTNNDRYANGKGNKFYVGKDAEGKPTTDFAKVVAPSGKAGVDYHMLSLRFEIDF